MEYLSAQMKSVWEEYTSVICCLGLEIKPIIEVYHPNRVFLKTFLLKSAILEIAFHLLTFEGEIIFKRNHVLNQVNNVNLPYFRWRWVHYCTWSKIV